MIDAGMQLRKLWWPDSLMAAIECERLGEDEHGVWMELPRGGVHRGPAGQTLFVNPGPIVGVLRADQWWTAWWWGWEDFVKVDICEPPTWREGQPSFVDLQLDVKITAGVAELVDDDELTEEAASRGYPSDLVERVRRTGDEVMALVVHNAEPFASVGPAWLAKARTFEAR